ncbi:hypothetical protein L0657_04650 [Dyadobacter sp. CY345]|uniref:DNA-formamidopyrimidine glycosylase family protein n=1 Tax=Dyadobacter sp. CY345 TaxID=2909335 RepID=UPI001F1DB9FD|nr:DNA-formamidopyrimidine glycosylase family protein [Dyadobacter sp. CY345]MCF2443236.1 hypothetical protein [Dyadobacter sp. CY345]
MPEIPELNVLAKIIERKFRGQKVDRLEINWVKKLNAPKEEYQAAVTGQVLQSVSRAGKELCLNFKNRNVLSIHLMIIGTIDLLPVDKPAKYSIFDLWFDNDEGISVGDSFGQAKLSLNPKQSHVPEVLTESFTMEYLTGLLKDSFSVIKLILLDQKRVVGLGNASVDEILYASRISPLSVSKYIPLEKVQELYENIQRTMDFQESILLSSGSIEETFKMKDKSHRLIHNPTITHTEEGEEIVREKLNGRMTYHTASQIKY